MSSLDRNRLTDTQPYDIRPATLNDVVAIAALAAETFSIAYGDIVMKSDMASYVARYFDPDQIRQEIEGAAASYFVAVSERQMLGYAKLAETEKASSLPTGRVAELIRIYVKPGCYGLGIGSALLSAAQQQARADGYAGLWLRVWQNNDGAIRLYERSGFQTLAVEPYLIGDTANPVLVMLKSF